MNTPSDPKKIKDWKIGLYDSSNENETFEKAFAVRLEDKMPAYVVVDLAVIDSDKFEVYRQLVPATITQFGGRYIARGGKTQTLEGTWSPKRLVILEFPSIEKAKEWMDSPEYAHSKALRRACARSQIIIVEGI